MVSRIQLKLDQLEKLQDITVAETHADHKKRLMYNNKPNYGRNPKAITPAGRVELRRTEFGGKIEPFSEQIKEICNAYLQDEEGRLPSSY